MKKSFILLMVGWLIIFSSFADYVPKEDGLFLFMDENGAPDWKCLYVHMDAVAEYYDYVFIVKVDKSTMDFWDKMKIPAENICRYYEDYNQSEVLCYKRDCGYQNFAYIINSGSDDMIIMLAMFTNKGGSLDVAMSLMIGGMKVYPSSEYKIQWELNLEKSMKPDELAKLIQTMSK